MKKNILPKNPMGGGGCYTNRDFVSELGNKVQFPFSHNFSKEVQFKKKFAFTLAEVLITLGVIGIVAALMIPQLTKRHRILTTETRLAKFYSVMNQALKMSIAEHETIEFTTELRENDNNGEYIAGWFRENITKYIKTITEDGSHSTYYYAAFADGSGFRSYMNSGTTLYIFYCVNYSKCARGQSTNYDGINGFLFSLKKGGNPLIAPVYSGSNEIFLKNNCKNNGSILQHGCAALIKHNGWKIPKDYPLYHLF